jgi:hypothetical protein
MLRRWNLFIMAVGLAMALGVGASSTASTFTAQQLVDGASFDSPDGNLHFNNFKFAVVTGSSLSTNLSDYQVTVDGSLTSGGFRITGPIGVTGNNSAGIIQFAYDVTANSGPGINSVGLYVNGRASGPGARAIVSEDIFAPGIPGPLAQLSVVLSGEEEQRVVDYVEFEDFYTSLHIEKAIDVGTDEGTLATISVIDQNFTVVPEPSTASLMVLGLLGAGVWRSHSQSRVQERGGGARNRERGPRRS